MKTTLKRQAFSLLELLAVVVILGIIAALVVPRITTSSTKAKQEVHAHNLATLNAVAERFFVETGGWPNTSLSNVGTDYLPNGVPAVPIDSSLSYEFDTSTNRVVAQ